MSNGFMGRSLVCYATDVEAAQASCAATANCDGLSSGTTTTAGPAGAEFVPVTVSGVDTYVSVQPCDRIGGDFYSLIWPAFIPAIVAVLCARWIFRQFSTHA